jgi:dolichyl-phosphate-mannose-protein mannosyltransferase
LVSVAFACVLLASVFLIGVRLGGLVAATAAALLLLLSPAFLELSSSCMMEIPALAPAIAAIAILLYRRPTKLFAWEIAAGLSFGIALAMKLIGLALLPVIALAIIVAKSPPSATDSHPLPSRVFCFFRGSKSAVLPFAVFFTVSIASLVSIDLAIDRGAFLTHFHQSWASHFTPAVSFEYGSPKDHRFDWLVLLKHWEATLPAVLGLLLVAAEGWSRLSQHNLKKAAKAGVTHQRSSHPWSDFRPWHFCGDWKLALGIFSFPWLFYSLTLFSLHTPWWSYYYVHISVPLSLCAGIGFALLGNIVGDDVRRLKHRLTNSPTKLRRSEKPPGPTIIVGDDVRRLKHRLENSPTKLRRSERPAGSTIQLFNDSTPATFWRLVAAIFLTLAATSWGGMRAYMQIAEIRRAPQTYYALVLNEIQRFKPFTHWIYTDNLTYSFHAGIPVPPQLAVVSLKRIWSGELTLTAVADEVRKFKPGLIALRNDSRPLPFQDLMNSEYRLVYQDPGNRLYAHKTIANKPDSLAVSRK